MRIGVDLGGTKIEAAALDDCGVIVARHRVPTPGTYAETLDALGQLIARVERQPSSIGIGVPGSEAADGRILDSENTPLQGQYFRRDLQRRMRRPVSVANDAACFALSEARDGAGQGARVVFGVIIGTGTNGILVVDGQAVAGEWGHWPLPWALPSELPGPQCYCGRRGCIEMFLSGPGLERDHRQVTGEIASAAEIARSHPQTIQRYAERLARALTPVVELLHPEVIVLGGGVSKIAAIYDLVPSMMSHPVRVLRAVHGDASGVRGAAWLADR